MGKTNGVLSGFTKSIDVCCYLVLWLGLALAWIPCLWQFVRYENVSVHNHDPLSLNVG